MSAPLRGGLVGCGFFAINQLHAWRDVADAEIVAVCDTDPARLQIVGDQFGIARRYTDAGAMLAGERLDFMDVATTAPSHRSRRTCCSGPRACDLPEAVRAHAGRCPHHGECLR